MPKGVSAKLTRLCLRILAVTFGVVVVVSVAVAITLILTQKPVDLSDFGSLYSSTDESYHKKSLPPVNYTRLTFAELFAGATREPSPLFTCWLSNDDLLVADDYSNLFLLKSSSNFQESHLFISNTTFDGDSKEILVSSDAQFVAHPRESTRAYRHSTIADYAIYRIENATIQGTYPTSPIKGEPGFLQLFVWNPKEGTHDYVIVYQNNIYYQSEPSSDAVAKPITNGGNIFTYFGVTDWLYEEEILQRSSAIWWSPSGDYIAYASFNDSKVQVAQIQRNWATQPNAQYDQYPYPTAGTPQNPAVDLWVWTKKINQSFAVSPPDELISMNKTDIYLYSVEWITQKKIVRSEEVELLLSVWATRSQNVTYISLCDPKQNCKKKLKLLKVSFKIDNRSLWSEPLDFGVLAQSQNSFFVLLPRKYKDGNIYNHVARLDKNDLSIKAYFGGPYDVSQIVAYNKKKDQVFFLSAGGTIGQMHLYRISEVSKDHHRAPFCISCGNKQSCTRNNVAFSPTNNFYIHYCSAPYKTVKLSLWDAQRVSEIKIFESGRGKGFSFELPLLSYEKVQSSQGFDAHVRMVLPPEFNKRHSYPVLLYTYAGPNTVSTEAKTPWDFATYFANRRQYIVVTIDGAGSGNRGWNVKEKLYKNLGGAEVADQIEVLRHLLKKYSFMDPSRVAAFGWSYGGFVTTHIGAKDAGKTVQCIIAVAPVVDFRYYDSAYSERYLGLLQDNFDAYVNASLVFGPKLEERIEGLSHVKLLLAHGGADDNVHFHNSAVLASVLQQRLITFKQLVYPNEDHSLHNTVYHLYLEVDKFLLNECYNIDDS